MAGTPSLSRLTPARIAVMTNEISVNPVRNNKFPLATAL